MTDTQFRQLMEELRKQTELLEGINIAAGAYVMGEK